MITNINQLDLQRHYTYADYLTWRFKERVELLRGRIAKMSPAPSRKHQETSGQLFLAIGNFLEGKPCRIYSAPFDVRLASQGGDTVVQPDLCVVCDLAKLDEQGCNGAPDLVIEILSPGNSRRELKDKFDLYEASAVQEYWIVSPSEESIIVYALNEQGKYTGSKPFVPGERVISTVFPDMEVEVGAVFLE